MGNQHIEVTQGSQAKKRRRVRSSSIKKKKVLWEGSRVGRGIFDKAVGGFTEWGRGKGVVSVRWCVKVCGRLLFVVSQTERVLHL